MGERQGREGDSKMRGGKRTGREGDSKMRGGKRTGREGEREGGGGCWRRRRIVRGRRGVSREI